MRKAQSKLKVGGDFGATTNVGEECKSGSACAEQFILLYQVDFTQISE